MKLKRVKTRAIIETVRSVKKHVFRRREKELSVSFRVMIIFSSFSLRQDIEVGAHKNGLEKNILAKLIIIIKNKAKLKNIEQLDNCSA